MLPVLYVCRIEVMIKGYALEYSNFSTSVLHITLPVVKLQAKFVYFYLTISLLR